jgi:hypothetical protein
MEGKIQKGIEVTRRQARRRNQLLDNIKETEDSRNRERKHFIALCGKLALEEVMDFS